MPAFVILNPYANRWSALKQRPEAEKALTEAGVEFELQISQAPGDAVEIARHAAVEGYSPIIAAGGDGTIGEVVNGLYRANDRSTLGPFGVLPLGTANDLIHNLGLPLDLPGAAAAIANGHTRRIDLGKVNDWVFCNNSAIGLEPVVTLHNIHMKRTKGIVRYLLAALKAIAENHRWDMKIEWDDGEYEGPISLVSVGNCPLTGGMFHMAPDADPADGRLTFVRGYAPTRRRMLALLPRTITGSYIHQQGISQHHTRCLRIQSHQPSPLQVDGELRTEADTHFKYEVLQSRLDILVPGA